MDFRIHLKTKAFRRLNSTSWKDTLPFWSTIPKDTRNRKDKIVSKCCIHRKGCIVLTTTSWVRQRLASFAMRFELYMADHGKETGEYYHWELPTLRCSLAISACNKVHSLLLEIMVDSKLPAKVRGYSAPSPGAVVESSDTAARTVRRKGFDPR